MKHANAVRSAAQAASLALAILSGLNPAHSQTLPSPPISPAPVTSYEYDAQGNRTKITAAPGVASFGFASSSSYDKPDRVATSTDARSGVIQYGYNGRQDLTQVTDPRNLLTQYPRNGLGDATQLISPDTGTASHTYDAAGNLKTRLDSRGVLSTYTYDPLNRIVSVVHSQGANSRTLTHTYDQTGTGFAYGIGRLTSSAFPEGSTQYSYSPHGRLVSAKQVINALSAANRQAITHSTTYAYVPGGNIASITYPSGRVLEMSHVGGQLKALSLKANASATALPMLSQISWRAFGPVSSWNWHLASGSTQVHERVYDLSNRMIRYRLGHSIRDISYDAANRISGYTHYDANTAAPQSSLEQAFAYDELGRITGISTTAASWSIGYDANGNRTSVTQNASTRAYSTASTSNRLTNLTNPAVTFSHDAAGNTTAGSAASTAYTATYGLDNRLATMRVGNVTSTYTQDTMGQRVRKYGANSSSTVIFVYDQRGHLLGEYNSSGAALREYVWLGDEPVAMFTPANGNNPPNIYYIHSDHLGAPRIVMDKANGMRWRWMAEPFGTTAAENNPSGLGAFTMNLRLPGQYFDAESGLHYNYFRNYDASTGRYVQSDPIGLAGGINTYLYANAAPTMYTDPRGLDPWGREAWTPARVYTDMREGTTTYFDPSTRDLLVIPTRNQVASQALPGAAGPYSGRFTYCEYPNSLEFGTAKWRTTDSRARWVHGGGSRFGEMGSQRPRQGWAPTMGCTRAQNEDVEQLCKKSEAWSGANPGKSIPYSRW